MAADQGRPTRQRRQGCKPGRSRPRLRRCLLKGCEKWFRARHHWQRFCCESCSEAARVWARKRQQRRYRESTKGRDQRRKASREYRRRQKEKPVPPASPAAPRTQDDALVAPPAEPAEDPRRPRGPGDTCDRPGCYEHLSAQERHRGRRFCALPCWRALRAVLQREARWRARLRPVGQRPRPPHPSRRE